MSEHLDRYRDLRLVRVTAAVARNGLREEGLIRDDTPRAIWEISEKGREWLAEQRKAALR